MDLGVITVGVITVGVITVGVMPDTLRLPSHCPVMASILLTTMSISVAP